MEKQKTVPSKDGVLHQLGVRTKRVQKKLSPHTELASVDAGRQLLKRNTFMTAVMVAVSGSANVSFEGTHMAHLEAPFVLDGFLADERRVAQYDVVANADTTMLVVDCRSRAFVFEQAPALAQLSTATQAEVEAGAIIDLTERAEVSIPTHT